MKHSGTILLVDDEADFRENIAEYLQSEDLTILHAGEAESAIEQVKKQFVDVALVDVMMPGMDGISLLKALKEIDPVVEIIMVTGQGSIESAVEAMRLGAHHFITKPVRLKELAVLLGHAMEKVALAKQNLVYREEIRRRTGSVSDIVAASPTMAKIMTEAEQIAETDMTVLIDGETGAGKGVLAEFIHLKSQRHSRAYSVLNCGALPDNLLDAELFGAEKGAFTGASETRPGMFEVSDGGTLLLDEIGDMNTAAQVRLLRVLETGLFRRVGSARERAVDVRILAATYQDLATKVKEGSFREDLYHRLNVFRLHIPPLRERIEDIIPLAAHFLERLTQRGRESRTLSKDAETALHAYSWPGNVRELAHVIERACFSSQLAEADEISREHLNLAPGENSGGELLSLKAAHEQHIRRVLARTNGNRQKAAEVLGITERHLYRLISANKGTET
ncbi:MAG: sigma-54 dependent transcriptional regulator [Kiritimatiellia bacterium]|jgi:two-component system NtrC family response regulator/two-component system response regulator AtoC|nr:sigma-54 dependent transcriptional regulator [Kiritimatiellia bacterium]MDP6848299.1 sigma-54 dependent transcriptional regulator [Kiritimatiellia bacterium]